MPIIPWYQGWDWWDGIEIAHQQVAWMGLSLFCFLATLDLIWKSVGGIYWEKRAKSAKVKFCLAILSAVFGLYIVGPFLILFVLFSIPLTIDLIYSKFRRT